MRVQTMVLYACLFPLPLLAQGSATTSCKVSEVKPVMDYYSPNRDQRMKAIELQVQNVGPRNCSMPTVLQLVFFDDQLNKLPVKRIEPADRDNLDTELMIPSGATASATFRWFSTASTGDVCIKQIEMSLTFPFGLGSSSFYPPLDASNHFSQLPIMMCGKSGAVYSLTPLRLLSR